MVFPMLRLRYFIRRRSANVVESITYEDAGIAGQATNGTTSTFTNKAIGAAATGRLLVIQVAGNSAGGNPGLSGVTVDGNAATLVGSTALAGDWAIGTFKYALDAGTTANIVVSWNGVTVARALCSVIAVYGANHTETDSDAQAPVPLGTTLTSTIDVPTGGAAFAFEAHSNANATTWSGTDTTALTASTTVETSSGSSAVNAAAGAGKSMTATWTTAAARAITSAAFGP